MTKLRLEIDEFKLDEEWVGQPRLYHAWAERAAEATYALDQAKSMLELAKATVDRDVRDNPANYGLAKITESVVANTVVASKDYQDAVKLVNEARKHNNLMAAAVAALDHRKRALENLVSLHGRDYFSSPRASRESNVDAEEMAQAVVRRKAKFRKKKDE